MVQVKANAVRGLGNLSRSIQITIGPEDHTEEQLHALEASSRSFDWLEQMVQAFLSCVTTGNVKV